MNLKHFVAALALSTAAATSSQAAVVAGWDFSQYLNGGGLLSIDGQTFTNTLGANYSNSDPTFNAGPDSGVYGQMYMDGSFGSSTVTPTGNGDEAFLPFAGSLSSNLGGILPNPFDSLTIQIAQGAIEANLNRMQSFASVSVVFSGTPGAGVAGSDWGITFGARTEFAGRSITVEFSTDGTSYASLGSASLTATDTLYSFNAAPGTSSAGFFRLTFSGAGAQLDNVAIAANLAAVPEPATAGLLALGLGGLALLGRRRSL